LSRNGFALHNKEGRLVLCAPKKDNTYTVTMRTIHPHLGLCVRNNDGMEATDEKLHERLELKYKDPLVAFTTGGGKPISLYDWHRRMGHRSMKTIVDMAKGAATGVILKDLLDDILKLDSCPSCALTKVRHTPFKDERVEMSKHGNVPYHLWGVHHVHQKPSVQQCTSIRTVRA
jgi:hypothetical protein